MLIHHYSQSNGEYLSSGQPDADPRNPERWLVPSWATFDEPPARTPTTLAVLPRQRVDAAAGLPRPPLLSHRHGRTGRNRDCRQDARRTRPHDRTATVAAPRMDQRRVGHPGRAARARETRRRDGRVRATPRSRTQGQRRQGRCLRRGPARRRRRLLLQGLVGLPDGTRFGRPGRHVPRCGDVADYAGAVRTASASAAGTATATATGTGIEAPARRTQRTCSSGRGPAA